MNNKLGISDGKFFGGGCTDGGGDDGVKFSVGDS